MCLTNNVAAAEKFLDKNKNKEYVKVYKIVRIMDGRFITPYQNTAVVAGWNISNSNGRLSQKDGKEIEKGIHVYLNKPSLTRYDIRTGNKRALAVYAHVKDLLGAAPMSWIKIPKNQCHLLFKKIYIPEVTLKRYKIKFEKANLEPNPAK